jgi:hypothetical protein
MTPAFTFFVGLAMLVLFGWYDFLLRAFEIAAARTPGGLATKRLGRWAGTG